ncbi:hypothetical protein I6A84_19990 [Frankia sp. CNm7]|uniref:Uncharacterized protein n=1 Tax=Frankia nepalensis TaxID=1836974 RepID=A0A937RH34_9ACTN|nr:hypothetical protein [Frankia nepalensis]MBL7495613.1 hypothetical protein [Frankia nepalensis]MBL7508859.1 hypothetical protein [Frankia nepalensis]MBL7520307.1 hypothetical protein [Frankia nepalensis]MBL7630082.1 hypothetical protein [Frankia nepalensis]
MRAKAGRSRTPVASVLALVCLLAGCAGASGAGDAVAGSTATSSVRPTRGLTAATAQPTSPSASPSSPPAASATQLSTAPAPGPTRGPAPGGPLAGNPTGTAAVPAEAAAVDTSHPTRVIGDGRPASCTSDAVVAAVAAGGVITFDCGPAPVTITLTTTAKVVNAANPRVVLDGAGLVTLSGGGRHRILYMNTCDQAQGWTTSHCDDQDHPSLTVQNLTFTGGDSTGDHAAGGGGGAIFVRGGQLKIVNSLFTDNRCDPTGPDLGGAAVRVLDQFQDRPVYVVSSTFVGGSCSNGGALSSIGVSWTVLNSVFRDNEAIGYGANPARADAPGGGSGGAIYTDGNLFRVRIAGSVVEDNRAAEGGGAVFFVSNDRSGTLTIEGSTLRNNPSEGFETRGYPGIFFLGSGSPSVSGSTLH